MPASPLYLASASPRRRELVQHLGRPVIAGIAPVDEGALMASYDGKATGLAEFLACAKAAAALASAHEWPRDPALVLAADTTVILDGRALGKPRDDAEARDMLRALRGRVHSVITGVAVVRPVRSDSVASQPDPSPDSCRPRVRSAAVATRVRMRDYSDDEVERYIATGDPMDKAGAYAVQHADFRPVASVQGCYLTVVGLPLCAASKLIADAEADADVPSGQGSVRRSDQSPVLACPWSSSCRPPFPPWLSQATTDDRRQ
jgi:septum formation protein